MKSKKVLIVGTNDMNRKLFEKLLDGLYNFESVKSGVDAVERSSTEKFNLILMDIKMPDMDGITASKIIRRKAVYPCPIIAISSKSTEFTRKYFLEIGFDEHITKPILPEEFLTVISSKIAFTTEEVSDYIEEKEEIPVLDKLVLNQLLKYNPKETIKSIYAEFLEEFDELISYIDLALKEKNQQVMIEHLHTIKGNSGTLGAAMIFKLSSEADVKARCSEWESLEQLIKELKNERVLFDNYIKEETNFNP